MIIYKDCIIRVPIPDAIGTYPWATITSNTLYYNILVSCSGGSNGRLVEKC